VLPFAIRLLPGQPVYEQIVQAVKRALMSGRLRPGDRFPAIRALGLELGINPNTAQKAVGVLVQEGILEVRAGQGCFVAAPPEAEAGTDAAALLKRLGPLAEPLLLEAHRLGLSDDALAAFLRSQSTQLRTHS
jgi:GntR family transcriptional regulator